jgi:hypothetical protein
MTRRKGQYYSNRFVLPVMKLFVIVFVVLLPFHFFCQIEKTKNYRRFDERTFHFGFMLGTNSNDFVVYQKLDAFASYGLTSLSSKATAGGQVGIVSTMKLGTPVVRLRLIPTLSFQERVLNYSYRNTLDSTSKDLLYEERVGSTNLDFPLMFQFRTLRFNNFAAYLLLGGQFSIDLQSMEKASQSYIDPFIKIKKKDYQAQVGGGVEFFAPYFKFGIELKYSQGIRNAFIQDESEPALPIDRLYNQVLWLSFIFEG